jgi:hypothetical protein
LDASGSFSADAGEAVCGTAAPRALARGGTEAEGPAADAVAAPGADAAAAADAVAAPGADAAAAADAVAAPGAAARRDSPDAVAAPGAAARRDSPDASSSAASNKTSSALPPGTAAA